MSESRREFLKFVVAGSIAAGCPVDLSLLAAPGEAKSEVHGEQYEICHKVRDGEAFTLPPVGKRHDIVIVGAGMSGLAAAYFLGDKDFLLLEKEDHWGGNAFAEEYQGQAFATGSAYDFAGSDADAVAKEIGLKQLPVNSPDALIANGKWVSDIWRAGLDELPYSQSVRDGFKRFKKEFAAVDFKSNVAQLDSEPLTKYLQGYPEEIARWWTAYGTSSYAASAADTSAYVAREEFESFGSDDPDPRVTLPGGNGAITKKLSETLLAKRSERMLLEATTIAVTPQKDSVEVTYSHAGQLQTVSAKIVVVAAPKLIASRLVPSLSDAQRDAMQSIRYLPYALINMVFDKPVFNRGYDTYCPGAVFSDFTVADWTVRNQPGYKQKNNILSFYTPMLERDRRKLLTVDGCRRIAATALGDFSKLLPEFNVDPVEVHFFRRGHPMFISAPGLLTKIIPVARVPLDRVFFANTDSEGPESSIFGAAAAAHKAAEWTEKRLAGTSAAAASKSVGYAI